MVPVPMEDDDELMPLVPPGVARQRGSPAKTKAKKDTRMQIDDVAGSWKDRSGKRNPPRGRFSPDKKTRTDIGEIDDDGVITKPNVQFGGSSSSTAPAPTARPSPTPTSSSSTTPATQLHEPVLPLREDNNDDDSDGTQLYDDADLEGLFGDFGDWPDQWSAVARGWLSDKGLIDVDAFELAKGGPVELLDDVSKRSSSIDARQEAFYVDEYDDEMNKDMARRSSRTATASRCSTSTGRCLGGWSTSCSSRRRTSSRS